MPWRPLPVALSFAAPTIAAAAQTQSADQQVYERFRAWLTTQPPAVAQADDAEVFARYREVLRQQGLSSSEIERQVRVIQEQGQRLEVERWNQILTSPSPSFNTEPNAFLVQIASKRKAGTALDAGMGQGRNAIYLAQHGWTVTGFDPAERAVAAAQDEAKRLGVSLNTQVIDDEHFDWGRERWDLILLSYVAVREIAPRVVDSLRPGGVAIVEGFHRDATKGASIGGGVVFDTNELLTVFGALRVIQYEDAVGVGDFGRRTTRIVRLAAEKVSA